VFVAPPQPPHGTHGNANQRFAPLRSSAFRVQPANQRNSRKGGRGGVPFFSSPLTQARGRSLRVHPPSFCVFFFCLRAAPKERPQLSKPKVCDSGVSRFPPQRRVPGGAKPSSTSAVVLRPILCGCTGTTLFHLMMDDEKLEMHSRIQTILFYNGYLDVLRVRQPKTPLFRG